MNGARIESDGGSCGAAASLATTVFVSDIASDPRWAKYKHVALKHGLKASWSTPILLLMAVMALIVVLAFFAPESAAANRSELRP